MKGDHLALCLCVHAVQPRDRCLGKRRQRARGDRARVFRALARRTNLQPVRACAPKRVRHAEGEVPHVTPADNDQRATKRLLQPGQFFSDPIRQLHRRRIVL